MVRASIFKSCGDTCIFFLPGGNTAVGRTRFREWQQQLCNQGVSSISFDYSGVCESGGALRDSSLANRIAEASYVATWMREQMPARTYVLYGASMGGYIALGLIHERPGLFDALVLYAPAAYSARAHSLPFDGSFTKEIREKGSWQTSSSFDWLKKFQGRVLYITAGQDTVIPKEILRRYGAYCPAQGATHLNLPNVPHDISGTNEIAIAARNRIYGELMRFLA